MMYMPLDTMNYGHHTQERQADHIQPTSSPLGYLRTRRNQRARSVGPTPQDNSSQPSKTHDWPRLQQPNLTPPVQLEGASKLPPGSIWSAGTQCGTTKNPPAS